MGGRGYTYFKYIKVIGILGYLLIRYSTVLYTISFRSSCDHSDRKGQGAKRKKNVSESNFLQNLAFSKIHLLVKCCI